ncbi:type I iodothyronine deiodinase-like [Homarus americanus]|uniref:type I iodothyronine deiodinase-like n=1 Tax=Homarus americanus TaxID=6706 RepID=UPI001C48F914|nr:type I iodothyronine deiodinase-like [Homarus americanus]
MTSLWWWQLRERYSSVADFVVVYTAEAHPTDGWVFEGNVEVANHRSLEERYAAAEKLLEFSPQECEVLVDRLDDAASKQYAALPERLYIVQDGVVFYKGGRGPFEYKMNEVEDFLKKYKSH